MNTRGLLVVVIVAFVAGAGGWFARDYTQDRYRIERVGSHGQQTLRIDTRSGRTWVQAQGEWRELADAKPIDLEAYLRDKEREAGK